MAQASSQSQLPPGVAELLQKLSDTYGKDMPQSTMTMTPSSIGVVPYVEKIDDPMFQLKVYKALKKNFEFLLRWN